MHQKNSEKAKLKYETDQIEQSICLKAQKEHLEMERKQKEDAILKQQHKLEAIQGGNYSRAYIDAYIRKLDEIAHKEHIEMLEKT